MAGRKPTINKTKNKTQKRAPAKPRASTVNKNTPAAAKPEAKKNDALSLEIMGVIIISLCVFVILSVYAEGLTGAVGAFIRTAFAGLFGLSAYIFPFVIIAVCLYIIFAPDKYLSGKRLFSCIVLFLAISVFAHIGSMDTAPALNGPAEFIQYYFTNGSAQNGGLAGAVIGDFLVRALSKAGAYVVLSAAVLVCVIAITGKSFFRAVAALFKAIGRLFKKEHYDPYYEDDIYYEPEDAEEAVINVPPPPPPKPVKPVKKPKPAVINIKNTSPDKKTNTDDKHIALPEDEEPFIEPAPEKPKKPRILLINETIAKQPPLPPPEEPVPEPDSDVLSEKLRVSITKAKSRKDEDIEIKPPAPKQEDEGGIDEHLNEIVLKTTPEYDEQSEFLFDDDYEDEPEPAADPVKINTDTDDIWENPPAVYTHPSIELLEVNTAPNPNTSRQMILDNSRKLEEALKSFRVEAKVIEVSVGPTVTRYELSPGVGVKVSSISNLSDDLALNLAATSVRIEAPIPGKAAVGIEIPNKEAQPVFLREVISDQRFAAFPSKLAFGLGKDIAGNVVIADIARMPHMLIAGSTGSGKSVCINTLITSIIYKASPEDVKLLMVDPKVVELKVYNGIPHLLIPVVTDPKKAAGALNWAVREMTTRYDLFAETNVRDLKGYNTVLAENGERTLPQIVIIIDELADLMMTAGKEVEEYICRLAQMARAAGIHLIIATQRPSVDVITGLIKANIPSKIAFAVSSAIDSRTIIGEGGAEKLLGRGDMLFYPAGMSKPLRVQGSFISDKEVEAVVGFVKQNANIVYDDEMILSITAPAASRALADDAGGGDNDEFIEPAIEFIVGKEKASASMLQRQFRIGYNRASRIIEILEERGIVGPEDGSKPRKVLMSKYEYDEYAQRVNRS